MTIRELYEYANGIGAEDCRLTILCTFYDENDATAEDCWYCPCEDEVAHYKEELLIDVR